MNRILLLFSVIWFFIAWNSQAQTVSQSNQRYQVIEIDNLYLQPDSLTLVDPHPVGDKHNYLMINTQTGESWILSVLWNTSELSPGPVFVKTVAWRRLGFDLTEYKLFKERLPSYKTPGAK